MTGSRLAAKLLFAGACLAFALLVGGVLLGGRIATLGLRGVPEFLIPNDTQALIAKMATDLPLPLEQWPGVLLVGLSADGLVLTQQLQSATSPAPVEAGDSDAFQTLLCSGQANQFILSRGATIEGLLFAADGSFLLAAQVSQQACEDLSLRQKPIDQVLRDHVAVSSAPRTMPDGLILIGQEADGDRLARILQHREPTPVPEAEGMASLAAAFCEDPDIGLVVRAGGEVVGHHYGPDGTFLFTLVASREACSRS